MSFLVHVDVSILDPFDARMTRSIKALKLGVLLSKNFLKWLELSISHSETFFCSRHTLYKGAQQFSDQVKLAGASIFWQFYTTFFAKMQPE